MGAAGSSSTPDPNRTFDKDNSEFDRYNVENFGFVYRSRFKGAWREEIWGSWKPFTPEELVEKYPGQVRVIRGAKLAPDSSVFKGRPSHRRLDCEEYLQIILEAMRLYPKCATLNDRSISKHDECNQYRFCRHMLERLCALKVIKKPPPPRSSSQC